MRSSLMEKCLGVSLVWSTACHSAQYLQLKHIDSFIKGSIFLLQLYILPFHPLKVLHSHLKLLVFLSQQWFIMLLHFTHFLLNIFYLLLLITGILLRWLNIDWGTTSWDKRLEQVVKTVSLRIAILIKLIKFVFVSFLFFS